jgi:hypothetical protein
MPPRLFRFLPKTAHSFLDERKLWFSNILDFNDPFDATPSLKQITDEMYESPATDTSGDLPIPGELREAIENDKAEATVVLTQFLREKSRLRWPKFFHAQSFRNHFRRDTELGRDARGDVVERGFVRG